MKVKVRVFQVVGVALVSLGLATAAFWLVGIRLFVPSYIYNRWLMFIPMLMLLVAASLVGTGLSLLADVERSETDSG